MTKEEILKNCTVEGNVVKLPNIKLDRKLYLEVAKSLELIGGKWIRGKVSGFVFAEDPTELLSQVANGEKLNLKKKYQFFATPDQLADHLVELADIKETDSILEPSAGQGAIIYAIQRIVDISVDCCELMEVNRTFLDRIPKTAFLCENFFTLKSITEKKYDKIIANPPFSKNQDIDHIREMYNHLKEGGRLVTISSTHWQLSENRKETEFRNWLEKVEAEIYSVEQGAFKESGTMIGSLIIVINKPCLNQNPKNPEQEHTKADVTEVLPSDLKTQFDKVEKFLISEFDDNDDFTTYRCAQHGVFQLRKDRDDGRCPFCGMKYLPIPQDILLELKKKFN